MKRIIFLLHFSMIIIPVIAQWHFHNPLPQGNTLWDVQFVSASNGWAIGDGGTILHTLDGGKFWDRIDLSVKAKLCAVSFLDIDLGFVCGDGGTILRTSNGGETWETLYSSSPYTFHDIDAALFPRVMVVGDKGNAVFSEDGGISWTSLAVDPDAELHSVFCVNSLENWAVGEEGLLLHSINGGDRWDAIESNTSVFLHKIVFINDTIGWIIGDHGMILKTSDGGERWEIQASGVKSNLYGLCFSDLNTGWIVGQDGIVLFTTDGGKQWHVQDANITLDLRSICNYSSQKCFAVGEYGILLKSGDGGSDWQEISLGFYSKDLWYGGFTSALHGWTCGYKGEIFHSMDAGITWNHQGTLPDLAGIYSDIEFTDNDHGWFVHPKYMFAANPVLHTSDKGETWDTSYFNQQNMENFCKISFVSPDTGWVGGMDVIEDPWWGFTMRYVILRTYKGGQSWYRKTFSKPNMIITYTELRSDLFFLDKSRGWAIGYSEGIDENSYDFYWATEILKTTNGGTSWQIISFDYLSMMLYQPQIFFVNKDDGWIYDDFSSKLYRTIDGGSHWEVLQTAIIGINDLFFSNPDNGWVVTYNGKIFRSTDGGTTWNEEMNPAAYGLNRILFTEQGEGWIFGDGSAILHLADTTTVSTDESLVERDPGFFIYPNPFTGFITISYYLEESGFVSLDIINDCGQVVAELTNKIQTGGNHQYTWQLPRIKPGVYFCRLNNGSRVIVSKIVLMK
jgi:photosystem II stability/assembly factor-like uncharacterized protein